MKQDLKVGRSSPLGAIPDGSGANFSLFSRSVSRVELLFFDRVDDVRPAWAIDLDPRAHRTYHLS